MYIFENPVLQRELLVNLRTQRSFWLLALYQLLLAGVVLVAWPSDERLDLTENPPSARRLVNLFFLGQYVIASLMAPSFAAGTISGETMKELIAFLPGNLPRTSASEAAVPSTVARMETAMATRMLRKVAGTQPGRSR